MSSTVRTPVAASSATPQPAAPGESSLAAWFDRNRKLVTYIGAAILILVAGGWLYVETGRR